MFAFPGLLTLTVFVPAIGAVLLLALVRGDRVVRGFAFLVGLADLILSAVVFLSFERGEGAARFQLVDRLDWITAETFNASYFLGVDGLSAPMVLLTGLLGFCAIIASWSIKERVREYFVWLLLLHTAVMGVFASLDFLLFFLFWELELLPMYMLIANWGTGRKTYSAMKFLIFTILGSAFMLVGIVAIFLSQSIGSFDMTVLLEPGSMLNASSAAVPLSLMFWLFFAAFAVKLPTWPVHTWLPDAHTDAPTAASVMLAGVMLKMGGYGLLRVNVGMFPGEVAAFAWALILLGVISVLYGAVVTLRQTDLKRLIANSSVSHMGLVLVGVGSVGAAAGQVTGSGLNGAAMQLFTHGTITRVAIFRSGPHLRQSPYPLHSRPGRAGWPYANGCCGLGNRGICFAGFARVEWFCFGNTGFLRRFPGIPSSNFAFRPWDNSGCRLHSLDVGTVSVWAQPGAIRDNNRCLSTGSHSLGSPGSKHCGGWGLPRNSN